MNGFVRSALPLLAEMLRCLILGGSLILGDVGGYMLHIAVWVEGILCGSGLGCGIFGIVWFYK